MISGILFDFGGTLDSDGGHWLDRTYHIYTKLGLTHIDKSLIKEAFYWADAQAETDKPIKTATYRAMLEQHFTWQFQKLKLNNAAKHAEAVALFVRAAERVLRRNRGILEKLHHQGLKLGVVTNSYGNIETLCREFGYNNYLSVYIDSAVEGVAKPDPRIYTLALNRLKTPAGATLMVGDNFDRDIVPAKGLGMKTAWLIGDHKRTCPDPSKVDVVLRSIEELPQRLEKV